MRRCSAIKANGDRCGGIASGRTDYCPAHDPARADARIKAASKAARSRSAPVTQTDIIGIKDALRELYAAVLEGRVERQVGAVCAQVANSQLRAIELDRRLREQDGLEEKLDALASLLESAEESSYARW
jgi:hypothetical protein